MKNTDTIEMIKDKLNKLVERTMDADYTLTVPKQSEESGIPYNTFKKYYDGTSEPSASNLRRIAEYYDVSCDYLMGLTKFEGTNRNARFVFDFTGLSESAVNLLHSMAENEEGKERLYALSLLIEHTEFCELLDGLVYCLNYASWTDDLSIAVDIIAENTGRIIDDGTKERIARFRASNRKATVFDIQRTMSEIASGFIDESEKAAKQKTASGNGAESGEKVEDV